MSQPETPSNPAADAASNPEAESLRAQGNALLVQALGSAGSEADDLRRQAEELFAKAKTKAEEWSGIAQDKAKQYTEQATAYTKENPLKAVGIAAAFGWLMAMLLGRKK